MNFNRAAIKATPRKLHVYNLYDIYIMYMYNWLIIHIMNKTFNLKKSNSNEDIIFSRIVLDVPLHTTLLLVKNT